MNRRSQLPLRPNVCMLIINDEGKLFLGERKGERGIWQFPQGGAEPDVSLEENVLRELEEELGAPRDCFKIIRKLKATYEYEWKKPRRYGEETYRGQTQSFWLVRFRGSDAAIDLHLHSEPEFMAFGWFSAEEIPSVADRIRVPGYLAPLGELREIIAADPQALL